MFMFTSDNHVVASELKDPIWHSLEWQIGSFSSEATMWPPWNVYDIQKYMKESIFLKDSKENKNHFVWITGISGKSELYFKAEYRL